MHWTDYGYLALSAMYFGFFLFERKKHYPTIGDIEKDTVFGKKLHMTEISLVRQFAGDYIFKAESQELGEGAETEEEKSLEDQLKNLKQNPFSNPSMAKRTGNG